MSLVSELNLTPITKLLKNLSILKSESPSKLPVVLLTTGSMNPIHKQHYDNFEIAKNKLESLLPKFKVIGGYISPSQDIYVSNKLGKNAISIDKRIDMCKLSVIESDWIDIDLWESKSLESNKGFIDFWEVLYRLSNFLNENDEINEINNYDKNIKVFYLCGSDHFMKTYLSANLLQNHGYIIIGRKIDDNWIERIENGLDVSFGKDIWRDSVMIVNGENNNVNISSTTIRKKLTYNLDGWEDLCDPKVVNYIKENKILISD